MREWLEIFLGPELAGIASAIAALLIALVFLLFLFFLYRQIVGPRIHSNVKGRAKRLQVMDASPVDAKRRLVLVRRDDTEHLILIGGPNDLLIEPRIMRGQNMSRPRPNMQRQNVQMARAPVQTSTSESNTSMQVKSAPPSQHSTPMPKTTDAAQNVMAGAAAVATSTTTMAQNIGEPLDGADSNLDTVETNNTPPPPINVNKTIPPSIELATGTTQPSPPMPTPVAPEVPEIDIPASQENPPVPEVETPETNADETGIDLADFEQNLAEDISSIDDTKNKISPPDNDDANKTLEDEMEQLLGELSGDQSLDKPNS